MTNMRTTVDLPDPLFRQMKATAALRDISIKDLVSAAVESEIVREESTEEYSVKLPLIRSKRPGTLHLTNAEIEDLLT